MPRDFPTEPRAPFVPNCAAKSLFLQHHATYCQVPKSGSSQLNFGLKYISTLPSAYTVSIRDVGISAALPDLIALAIVLRDSCLGFNEFAERGSLRLLWSPYQPFEPTFTNALDHCVYVPQAELSVSGRPFAASQLPTDNARFLYIIGRG
ncbi:hypothetical protein BYT27DRAFT_7262734 [Phlegmacium glaucopus]|nr:hypothetical protein BYT27DRAFT_7262734 [Phlegmacium glaucopus]